MRACHKKRDKGAFDAKNFTLFVTSFGFPKKLSHLKTKNPLNC
jgi:hypothetical protein